MPHPGANLFLKFEKVNHKKVIMIFTRVTSIIFLDIGIFGPIYLYLSRICGFSLIIESWDTLYITCKIILFHRQEDQFSRFFITLRKKLSFKLVDFSKYCNYNYIFLMLQILIGTPLTFSGPWKIWVKSLSWLEQ